MVAIIGKVETKKQHKKPSFQVNTKVKNTGVKKPDFQMKIITKKQKQKKMRRESDY